MSQSRRDDEVEKGARGVSVGVDVDEGKNDETDERTEHEKKKIKDLYVR